ncbi:MAG: M20/M25/M40 family metallo-hydrolase [Gammaproteobacteria bacterium]|nr:MAG: M20/M25/M40 family metallo-hydrolase [Gammaproteobacteria bacterium]
MRRLLWLFALLLLGFAALLVGRVALLVPAPTTESVVALDVANDPVQARERALRLAGAIRIPTISHQDPSLFDPVAFRELHAYLEQTFPLAHANLERELVAQYSLLYRWPGHDPAQQPYLLMAHLDVVPVIPGTEPNWQHAPFGGEIADGYIWGRGTLDDKFGVTGILDAIEGLLQAGFQPSRDVYLAFGHDEELGGDAGAAAIAGLFEARGIDLAYVLDEGGAIIEGTLPGLDRKVALTGIAEKGFLSLELTTKAAGGHSSMPPPSTAIGVLSRAVSRLEASPFPMNPNHLEMTFAHYLAPYMSFEMQVLAANLWLFGPLLATSDQMNAMLRTTTAVTMFNAGIKENVLPINARAVVNHRIIPGETVASVTARVIEIIDDGSVSVAPLTARDPSGVSDTGSTAFAALARTVRQLNDDVIIAPYLVVGGTDAKHFAGLSQNIYRFSPILAEPDMMTRFHGTNERLAVDEYARVVSFYAQLIRNSDQI